MREVAPGTVAFTEWLGDIDPQFGPILTHSYLIAGSERAALIDAGLGIGDILAAAREIAPLPIAVVLTHSHYDHVGGAHQFDEVAINEAEVATLASELSPEMRAFADALPSRSTRLVPETFSWQDYDIIPTQASRLLRDGDTVDLGDRRLAVVHTPGHSPGSSCFLEPDDGLLFTGDTVYQGGLTLQLEGSDPPAFADSLQRLTELADKVHVALPAHFTTPLDTEIVREIHDGCRALLDGAAPRSPTGPWDQASFDRFTLTVRQSPTTAQDTRA